MPEVEKKRFETVIRTSKNLLLIKIIAATSFAALIIAFMLIVDVYTWWLILAIILIAVIYSIKLIAIWITEYFIISTEDILHKKGVLRVSKSIVLLKNIERITFEQTLFGQIIGYGTIRLYAPTIQQEFYIQPVENPQQITKEIETSLQIAKGNLEMIKNP